MATRRKSPAVGDYCADVMTEPAFEALLREILFAEPGTTIAVAEAAARAGCAGPPARGPGKDLCVTWTQCRPPDEEFAVVLFFSPWGLWSWMAIQNRGHWLREWSRKDRLH